MAAVLACGPEAVLSHDSAAALWKIRRTEPAAPIHVSIPLARRSSGPGLVVHRRKELSAQDVTIHAGIPTTTVECTLIDMAPRLTNRHIDAMLNEADQLDLIDWEAFSAHLNAARTRRQPGAARMQELVDERLIVLTDSELERMFLRISKKAGLAPPESGTWLNGFKTDFYWPDHGLVVECDSLRHHRTAAEQTRDRERDQAHLLAGLTPLRFTHAQIAWRMDYVASTLAAVAARQPRPQPE